VDQKVARKCYENNLRYQRGPYALPSTGETNNFEIEVEPSYKDQDPKPVGGFKEVQLPEGKTLRIGSMLSEREQEDLLSILQKYIDAFAWTSFDILRIDTDFLCHHLALDPNTKLVK